MAKFQFKLATLLKPRETHLDEMRAKLAEAYQAEELLAKQASAVQEEIETLKSTQRTHAQTMSTDVNSLLELQRYQTVLRSHQTTLQQQGELLSTETEKRRQTLVESDRQVKLLVKLRDRQLSSFHQRRSKTEVKSLDEIASGNRGRIDPWAQ